MTLDGPTAKSLKGTGPSRVSTRVSPDQHGLAGRGGPPRVLSSMLVRFKLSKNMMPDPALRWADPAISSSRAAATMPMAALAALASCSASERFSTMRCAFIRVRRLLDMPAGPRGRLKGALWDLCMERECGSDAIKHRAEINGV